MTVLFWVSIALVVYAYAGYPLALVALARVRNRAVARAAITPNVSFIIMSDCGATVVRVRSSQFGCIVGSSKASSTVSGVLRRTCT